MDRITLPDVIRAIRGALAGDGEHARTADELDHDTERIIAALAALCPHDHTRPAS